MAPGTGMHGGVGVGGKGGQQCQIMMLLPLLQPILIGHDADVLHQEMGGEGTKSTDATAVATW